MMVIITGEKQRAPECTWVTGGGIGPTGIYYIYVAMTRKRYIREKLENNEKKLTF